MKIELNSLNVEFGNRTKLNGKKANMAWDGDKAVLVTSDGELLIYAPSL